MFSPENASRAVVNTEIAYLRLLPSTTDLVAADLELINVPGREFIIREMLKPLENDFDYIILDCPPSLGLLTVNALCAGSDLLVPLQCEYYALEGIAHLIKTVKLVKQRLNRELKIMGVLMTMFDIRNRLSRHVRNDVRRHFPNETFSTVIPRNVRLSEAPSFGKPVITYDARSKGAEAYLALAKEVVRRMAA